MKVRICGTIGVFMMSAEALCCDYYCVAFIEGVFVKYVSPTKPFVVREKEPHKIIPI